MQKITFKVFVACLLAVIAISTHAQIVLHEATDVTQTKATLSADFPDLSVEHGFQYKYGTLPEIDEFSRLALSSVSDPVQINTTGNAWSARTVKGWVESKSNLSVGQASVMSAKVKFSEPTTVTFEWSVDSEEGIGILSFIVDGKTVREISGAVDFTQVSYQATTGEHTLQWQYKKTAATNVGLDLGMVRNIDLQNTTEGEWISKIAPTSEFQLSNLYPEQNYIYRAYENNKYSKTSEFSTLGISVYDITTDNITQTKATINAKIDQGDAKTISTLIWGYDIAFDDRYDMFDSGSNLAIIKSGTYIEGGKTKKPTLEFKSAEPCKISFKASFSGGTAGHGYITISSVEGYYCQETILSHSYSTCTRTYDLPAGSYNIWFGASYGDVYVSDFNLSNSTYGSIASYQRKKQVQFSGDSYKLESLIPNTTYSYIISVVPSYSGELPVPSNSVKDSAKQSFTTNSVKAKNQQPSVVTQSTAQIEGVVESGDASIIATGLQYKDAEGKRWSDYPKDVTATVLSQNINRLKPNTTYHYRTYIQAQKCDTVFSDIGSFTTLEVKAAKPTLIEYSQTKAKIKNAVTFGDAVIYKRGVQFRKSDEVPWMEMEDGGNDAVYDVVLEHLLPNTSYQVRTYIQPAGCETVYGDMLSFTTLAVEALKPTVIKLAQHEVILQGTVQFGDASIYQRGMQFRKQGETKWEEIEDGGNESIFTLVKKGLEMSTTYEARTYVQPAGCDVIYSDILTFKTAHYVSDVSNPEVKTTQTTAVITFMLSDTDDEIEEAGIYYGSDSNKEQWKQVSGVMEGNVVKVTIPNLKYNARYYYRPYVKVNGQYYFYDDMGNNASFVTKDITATMTFPVITQTTVQIKADIDAGDANVTGWGYCFGDSYDSENFYPYEELTEIRNLSINKKYNIGLFCSVDGEYKLIASGDFTTKDVAVSALFFNVTQTKAEMRITVNSGDAEVTDFKYCLDYGDKVRCGDFAFFSGLITNMTHTVSLYGTINGVEYSWGPYRFTTGPVSVSARASDVEQTSATISKSYNFGDATYVSSGIVYGTTTAMTEHVNNEEGEIRLTELLPNTTYYYRAYVEVKEGGKIYSSRNSFKTPAIICTTSPVSNISNRSATMNGTIDCDGYSSAEFGFQWKQMEGWNSDPAFTKGVKNEDGSISVALVNGMLEPNTDYQYRAAVRYKGNIYYASNWETFRTESEFVYYPASVYTIYRTDRENNCLILCGYYVAGSEEVVAQGYEYWNTSSSARSSKAYAVANNVIQVTTDESMQYSLDLKALADGNYSVRAFVKTSSGNTIYGNTLAFGVQGGNVTGIDNVETTNVKYSIFNHILTIYNAANLSCAIYNLQGQTVEHRLLATDCEQFYLVPGNVYIIRLSNGMTYKVRI